MYFDASSVVLPGEHVLHAISPRGVVRIQGNDVHRLHDRLRSVIGRVSNADAIIAAVPPAQQAAVRAYLTGLLDAGVLIEGGPNATPASPSIEALPGGETSRVSFVTVREAVSILMRTESADAAPTIAIVVDDDGPIPTPDQLEQRARVVRWLLASRHNRSARSLRVFCLRNSGELVSLAASPRWLFEDLREVLSRLGVLRHLDVAQVPLVGLALVSADHQTPVFATDYESASAHVVRSIIYDSLFGRSDGAQANGATPRSVCVAGTRVEVELQLLEQLAETKTYGSAERSAWQHVDLLLEPTGNESLRYLQSASLSRCRTFPALLRQTGAGFWQCRAGGMRRTSLIRAKAIADVLLAALVREHYGSAIADASTLVQSHLAFADHESLTTLAAEWIGNQCNGRSPLHADVVERWSTPVWFGGITQEAECGPL